MYEVGGLRWIPAIVPLLKKIVFVVFPCAADS